MTQPQTKPPTPDLFFETASAYQKAAALKAAVELELFTAIAEGKSTASAIAARVKAAERGTRILLDYMVVSGFLTKSNNNYALTPDSAIFLNKQSPAYMGCVIDFIQSPTLMETFSRLTESVRKGGTSVPQEGTLAAEHPAWVEFAKAMAPLMVMPSQLIANLVAADPAKPLRVLDIAAGHGLFGLAFAKTNPQAEITALDWRNVLEVAKANAQKALGEGAARYKLLPGSAFDVDFGTGYDIVLLTNFLHHFDATTCTSLLKKCHAALAPNGRAVTLEFVPNPDRVSPPMPATFALTMLASTTAGDAYTFEELKSMYERAGFKNVAHHPLPPTMQSVVIGTK